MSGRRRIPDRAAALSVRRTWGRSNHIKPAKQTPGCRSPGRRSRRPLRRRQTPRAHRTAIARSRAQPDEAESNPSLQALQRSLDTGSMNMAKIRRREGDRRPHRLQVEQWLDHGIQRGIGKRRDDRDDDRCDERVANGVLDACPTVPQADLRRYAAATRVCDGRERNRDDDGQREQAKRSPRRTPGQDAREGEVRPVVDGA